MEHKSRAYKTRVSWSDEEENMLVKMWAQRIPEFRGPKKNSHIYREMAFEMRRLGLKQTDSDVKNKLSNLTSKYRKELVCGDGPSSWRLFPKIHHIIENISNDTLSYSEDSIQLNEDNTSIKLENGETVCSVEQPQSSQQQTPSLSSAAEFILPSPIPSPLSSPQHGVPKDKFNFQKQLLTSINEFRQEFKDEMHKLHRADARLIALEKEKVSLLRKQVSDAAELKDGVLKLLAEIGSSIKKE